MSDSVLVFACRLFQGTSYGCGFASWPTFGLAAAKWTWRFDFQQQYIGSGFLVPHIVAWSMLLGAVISWGIMWPLLSVSQPLLGFGVECG
jgi:uncharacterized oligopeptide transporter (OPT) family protein